MGAVRAVGLPSEDEERDREVVADDGGADEGVEDLVEAEDVGCGVGPAAVIAEGAEGLEHAAGEDESQSGGRGGAAAPGGRASRSGSR